MPGTLQSQLIDNSAVTAIYKGTPKGGHPAILRSYDSRKEPSPEFDCKIWEAGRATSATGLAFKPIQIGQSVFIDEGAGQYNPTPIALDEACINEWPGREIGLVVSIGTGKRPAGSDQNSNLWYEGFMGDFAEARRRLISKTEGCEETHKYIVKEGLSKRGVNIENYYRFNVEIGVGEFGMNEWNRLADISTGTRRYLGKSEVQRMNIDAAAKLAKINRAKLRYERDIDRMASDYDFKSHQTDMSGVPDPYPNAVELPAEMPIIQPPHSPPSRSSYESGYHETLEVPGRRKTPSPRSSNEHHVHISPRASNNTVFKDDAGDRFVVYAPTPNEHLNASGVDKIAITSLDEAPRPPEQPVKRPLGRVEPPPLPPKTPINDPATGLPLGRSRPTVAPYPLDDRPPPVVNMAGKPNYR
jgi:hypothetical protein